MTPDLRSPGWPDTGRTVVVGHRGAAGHAPENTFASFERGLELGADVIELDIHLSRDGQVVVIHDERLERTTDGGGLVGEHTLAELRRLDAGSWFGPRFAGQRIPTLDEVLAWARDRTYLSIEIKNGPIFYEHIEIELVELLARHRMRERALIISFDHHALRRIRELDPGLLTGVVYACRPVDPVVLAGAAGAGLLEPHWSFVTPEDVAAAHAAGLKVNAWATSEPSVLRRLLQAGEDVAAAHAAGLKVNAWATSEPSVLRRLLQAGVDAVTTNHPDVLVRLLSDIP